MRVIKTFIAAYLRGALIFILSFYALTAQPNGHMLWRLTWANGYLLVAYLLAYPLILLWAPRFSKNPLAIKSWTSQSFAYKDGLGHTLEKQQWAANHQVATRDSLASYSAMNDDFLNMIGSFLTQSILMLLAGPVLIGVLIGRWWLRRKL
ncbi:hypothetical protein [Lactiplantibacillus fabifermentans]|uniref:Uncharacterized protein n=2 Tax=Lactiplantibacillus fabifermentans TaxID=483011 RepID=A0A0R2NSQ3_9LACO|nr:hypothetical protein [Lactiplantibacillus fabifermentans]ETY74577.1 hypothetical protein LFAB_06715 [Lactiplantibacillus fabifermentans T30PCM01]KRO27771.1 hypothetical protein DY78_GL003021 [Lactiplantibacillus fabifermentans DSM 21115]